MIDHANDGSIESLSPCGDPRGITTPWKNHGQYIVNVAESAIRFLKQRLITEDEKGEIMITAVNSSCSL